MLYKSYCEIDEISPHIMKIIFTLTDYITKSEYDEQDINVESILSSRSRTRKL